MDHDLEYNPLIDKKDDHMNVVQAASVVYVDAAPIIKKPTVQELAQKESDKIRHKVELSNADGAKFIHADKLATEASEVNAYKIVKETGAKLKTNNWDHEFDFNPKEEPIPVVKEYIPDPAFKFQEKPYECHDYKSVYDDPNSLYKETYGTQGEEGYKSVYEKKQDKEIFGADKASDYKSVYES